MDKDKNNADGDGSLKLYLTNLGSQNKHIKYHRYVR